jgi:hypothetical protein
MSLLTCRVQCILKSKSALLLFAGFLVTGVIGCQESVRTTGSQTADDHSSHGNSTMPSVQIVFDTTSQELKVGVPISLEFHLEENGKSITELVPLHEKLAHLIVIREGLDQFSHLHPKVGTDGAMNVLATFPMPGNYFLYADFQPKNRSALLAKARVTVAGPSFAAAPLLPNAKPEVIVEDLKTHVTIDAMRNESTITFQIRDSTDQPVTDLQAYLGAMGHLVVVSADGQEYVHAHPIEDAPAASKGIVAFGAHLKAPGIYKLWGQFQRRNEIVTIPFVVEYRSKESDNSQPAHADH